MTTEIIKHQGIDFAGLTKPQLRALDKLESRKDTLDFISKGLETGQAALGTLMSHEVGAAVALTALVHTLWRLRIIDEVQAVTLFGLVLGKGLLDIVNPFN